jgi:hypothetical protein
MLEPWQPPVEKTSVDWKVLPSSLYGNSDVIGELPTGNNANQPKQAALNQVGAGSGPVSEPMLLNDGTEILSDALPDPVIAGQRYAAGGSSGRGSRRGGPSPEGPVGEIISTFYRTHREALRELEPNNRKLTTIQSPDWRPTQRDVDEMYRELLEARQRAPGAVDTKESGIGIGHFATESIPARSSSRDFTVLERAEINRIGSRYGCHTCGSRDPGTTSGNFILDHQRPSRLNPTGEAQHIFPQCLSCSARQGGLISRKVEREPQ